MSITNSAEEITILGDEYKPPKIYLEEGEPSGILVDILRRVELKMGINFNIQLYPWKRAYTLSMNFGYGIVGLSKNEERLTIIDYSDVLYFDEVILVVLKENLFEYNTLEDLTGMVLGINRGASYGDKFEIGKKEHFTVREDNGVISRLKLLLAKRIDVAMIDSGVPGFSNIISNEPFLFKNRDKFAIVTKPFLIDPNYLGFHKSMDRTEFLIEFNKALMQAKEAGDIDKIILSY